jgi:hypothetical protein
MHVYAAKRGCGNQRHSKLNPENFSRKFRAKRRLKFWRDWGTAGRPLYRAPGSVAQRRSMATITFEHDHVVNYESLYCHQFRTKSATPSISDVFTDLRLKKSIAFLNPVDPAQHPRNARVVVGSVTTSEFRVLYFFFAPSFGLLQRAYAGAKCIRSKLHQ